MGLVTAFRLEFRGVGVRLVDIARLHRQEFLLRGLAVRVLDFGNKVHQFHRITATDVVHLVGHTLVGDRHVVKRMHATFGDIVDVGKVANHVAVVEHLDGLALRNSRSKEHRAHIGPPPRAVNREVAQSRHRDAVKLRVGMRHQFVALLARRIQTNRIVDLVVFTVRDLAVQAINRTGRRIEQMLHLVVAAGLKNVEEADHIALHVGIRVRDGIAHARLCSKVHHLVELLGGKEFIDRFLVGEVHADKARTCKRRTCELLPEGDFGKHVSVRRTEAVFPQAPVLEAHIVIVVDIVKPDNLVPAGRKHRHDLRSDKARHTCHQNLHLPVSVHFFVILFVVAARDVVEPFLVVEVPAHRLLDAFLELEAWFPAQLLLELGRVDRVAGIVAQAVCDIGDEVHVFAFRAAEEPVNRLDHDLDDVDILPFVETADVVRLSDLPVMENHVDGAGVVFHKEPVAHVLALAVNRQRLLVADVVDEERNQLFGELVRTVVVGAVRHDGRHAVGVVERANEVVGTGLRSGIRAMRRVLGGLVEEVVAVGQVMLGARSRRRERGRDAFRVVHLQGTVDFVGRDVVEALALVLFRQRFPVKLRGLEQAERAHHVRLREGERVLDGAVHMAFCRQVNDAVDQFVLHELVERIEVADVHLHELVVRLALDVLEVREVARVGELVEVDNLVIRVLVHEQAHHVATNKACTAGNYDILHKKSPCAFNRKRSQLQFKREAQILERRVLRILLGKQRFKPVAHRPLDAYFGIVPHEATLVLGVVQAGALVNKCSRLAEHHEPVGKAFGNVELLLVFGRKRNAFPLAKRRASLAQVYRHVKDFAIDHADEFALRVLLLEMQAAEHALLALGFVVLHEHHIQAGGIEFTLVVGFHEVAALVAKDRRLDDSHALDGRLDEIELTHWFLLFRLNTLKGRPAMWEAA